MATTQAPVLIREFQSGDLQGARDVRRSGGTLADDVAWRGSALERLSCVVYYH